MAGITRACARYHREEDCLFRRIGSLSLALNSFLTLREPLGLQFQFWVNNLNEEAPKIEKYLDPDSNRMVRRFGSTEQLRLLRPSKPRLQRWRNSWRIESVIATPQTMFGSGDFWTTLEGMSPADPRVAA